MNGDLTGFVVARVPHNPGVDHCASRQRYRGNLSGLSRCLILVKKESGDVHRPILFLEQEFTVHIRH